MAMMMVVAMVMMMLAMVMAMAMAMMILMMMMTMVMVMMMVVMVLEVKLHASTFTHARGPKVSVCLWAVEAEPFAATPRRGSTGHGFGSRLEPMEHARDGGSDGHDGAQCLLASCIA